VMPSSRATDASSGLPAFPPGNPSPDIAGYLELTSEEKN
jgi:hypothetical protein